MSDDDPLEHGVSVAMTGAASASRVVEILIRQAQELKVRQAAGARDNAAVLQQRLDAQAEVASAYFTAAADPQWLRNSSAEDVAAAVRGVHEWAQVDPERFADQAEKMRHQYQAAFGVDLREALTEQGNLDSLAELAREGVVRHHAAAVEAAVGQSDVDRVSERPGEKAATAYDASRPSRVEAMEEAGTPPSVVKARTVADKLNANDPATAAAEAAKDRGKSAQKPATRVPRRQPATQRGR